MGVEINIQSLRAIINQIFDHIEHDLDRKRLNLEHDDYWDLLDSERYDLTTEPSGHGVGQLSDDWQFLSTVLNNKDQAIAYMLVHAAPLLRCIGESVGK